MYYVRCEVTRLMTRIVDRLCILLSNFFPSPGMTFWHDVMVKYTFTDICTPSSLVSLLCYAML
jgi:hypothetical protein